ncbi:MAG: nucleotidyltransferase family protein [Armatimonadetes bacterium]|nr:nucleotidyltransferase family protein [Armatimonadota bacterium]
MQSKIQNPKSKIPGLVLAAGESRRMGRMKPLLPLGSKTLLQRVVDGLLAAELSPVYVVLGHRADEVAACLADRPVEITRNERYREGMLSSVQWGADQLPLDAPAFVLALGDQPDVPTSVIRALRAEWEAHPGSIVVPTVGGKRGHPILIDALYRPALRVLRNPQTLRDLVHAPETLRREVPVEIEGLFTDLDTPEDYEALLRSGRYAEESRLG